MSRIFATGDTHGGVDMSTLNTSNFPEQKELTKDDYVIICGDFGVLWFDETTRKDEKYWREWLDTRNYTTVVVLGNHENYNRVELLPDVEMFGGTVKKYTDSIFILQRGAVYTIGGKTFFTMGGAMSTDQQFRKPDISWWEQEIPSADEFNRGLIAIEDAGYVVDYVVTHTCPARVVQMYMNACTDTYVEEFKSQLAGDVETPQDFYDRIEDTFTDKEYFEARKDTVARYFDDIVFGSVPLEFKRWFFGHFHGDWTTKDGRFTLIYNKVVELE